MARRKHPENDYSRLWRRARQRGLSRRALSHDLDMDRGRLNDLILGRDEPTLGELSKIRDKRAATRVWYEYGGETRSFWTGRRRSLDELLSFDEDAINDIIQEMPPDSRPMGEYRITKTEPGKPWRTTRIYSVGRHLREGLRAE